MGKIKGHMQQLLLQSCWCIPLKLEILNVGKNLWWQICFTSWMFALWPLATVSHRDLFGSVCSRVNRESKWTKGNTSRSDSLVNRESEVD